VFLRPHPVLLRAARELFQQGIWAAPPRDKSVCLVFQVGGCVAVTEQAGRLGGVEMEARCWPAHVCDEGRADLS